MTKTSDTEKKSTLRQKIAGPVATVVVGAGITFLAYHFAKRGAVAALKEFDFEFELPEGYEIINVAQI